MPRATKTDFIFSGWYLDSGLTDRLNLDGVYAQELNLYPAFVANALLDPANYIEVSSSRAITLYASDVATNNICIPMVKDVGVYKVFYDGVEIVPQNFYYDEATNKLIIANDEIDDVQVGMRYQIDVIYDDYTRDVYSYGVHNDSSRYAITSVDPYSKSTSSYLGIQFNSIAYSNIKRVTLDDNAVEYTLSSNKLMIAASIVDLYPVGKCLLQVYTDKGIIAKDITIANSGYYYPYNVSIDIETYPYVYVNFDYDFAADYYIVKIDSLEYSSLDHPELFNGTCFDATGLLKTATQSYSVIAVYGGTEYQTETKEFGYHLYSSKSDANMQSLSQACLENSYTVYGVTANTYITSAEELYDLLFYAALYYDKIDARIEGSGYEEFRAILICLDFDINEQNLLTLSSDYYSQRDSSGNILYEGEGDNKKAIHLDSSKYALDDIEFVLCMIQDVTSLLSEATAYSLALQQFTTSGLIPKQTYKIGIKFDSAMTPTVNRTKENTSDTINNNYYKPDYYIPFYSTTGLPSDYVFPIETQNLGDAEVYTSRELYLALEHGYNPIPKGTALQNLYKEIKKVLKGIVDTDMSQYEQALAIYQWLGTNVYYDHDAAKKAAEFKEYDDAHDTHTYNQVYGWSSYYMEGVFNNKLAVCNGIAAAYSAMLNMMGIPCHKINGTGNGDPHTWNELCIGGYWYISDPTWASGAAEGDYCEVLSFANFLLTYKEAKETYKHIDKPSVYGVSYADDVYFRPGRIMTFVYNTNTYSLDPSYYTASQTVTAAVNYIRNRVGTIQTGEIIEVPIYAFIDPPTITGYKHDRIAAKNDTGFCTIYYTKN